MLYAGNSDISSPLVFITLGKIYLKNGQSAGNFSLSTKATAILPSAAALQAVPQVEAGSKNTYNNYNTLPKISDHITKRSRFWLFFSWSYRRVWVKSMTYYFIDLFSLCNKKVHRIRKCL